jgi:hypothetical protein
MAQIKVVRTLADDIYTMAPSVVDINTAEQTLINDFAEPIVTIGGLIDVVGICESLTVVFDSGTFIVGETITSSNITTPVPSAPTAKVYWADTVNNTLYITSRVGTFIAGDTVTGAGSHAVATIGAQNTSGLKFTARYGFAPVSTTNFSVAQLTRTIPTSLNTTSWTFNGKLNTEAESNAIDLELVARVLIKEAWDVLLAKVNDWEGTIYYPL